VQLEPMKPKLKPPGSERSKPKCDDLLSRFAFKVNLRHYVMAVNTYNAFYCAILVVINLLTGRGLHSSTSQLNLSRF